VRWLLSVRTHCLVLVQCENQVSFQYLIHIINKTFVQRIVSAKEKSYRYGSSLYCSRLATIPYVLFLRIAFYSCFVLNLTLEEILGSEQKRKLYIKMKWKDVNLPRQ
jgi:hypothetical protein